MISILYISESGLLRRSRFSPPHVDSPGVFLTIDGIKIAARLLGRSACGQGIILRTKKFDMRVGHADFHSP